MASAAVVYCREFLGQLSLVSSAQRVELELVVEANFRLATRSSLVQLSWASHEVAVLRQVLGQVRDA